MRSTLFIQVAGSKGDLVYYISPTKMWEQTKDLCVVISHQWAAEFDHATLLLAILKRTGGENMVKNVHTITCRKESA